MNRHQKIILLLGGNKLNYGIFKKFKKNNYLVYVVDWNERPQILGDRHYRIDVKDAESIMYALKKDNVWDRVIFAYSSIDLAVSSVACLNKEIGLRTISEAGLVNAASKSMMTHMWEKKSLLHRLSKQYMSFNDDIVNLSTNMKLIIKPDNSASSRGITIVEKNSCKEVLKEAFQKASEEATNRKVVVEEFVEGTEYTVDMIGDSYGNVCVYGISRKSHTKNTENNKIAVKLHYNAESSVLQEKIAEYGILCYKALDFSASLGHLELLVKKDGTISPVEIGARSSGFIASDLVDIVSGSDYLMDMIKVHNGMKVETGFHSQEDKSSLYFFYDFPSGAIVKREASILDFCDSEITSRYNDRAKLKVGNRFSNILDDNARVGFEILEGPKSLMTIDYIREKEQKMLEYMLL